MSGDLRKTADPALRVKGRTRTFGGTGRGVAILVATSLGVVMDGIDTTGMVVANPTIAQDLGADLRALQWIINGYLLAMAVCVIAGGRLGDRFGHKRVFLTGLVGFAIASALVGTAGTPGLMIVWRVCQGLFGSVLMPTSLAILRFAFPGERIKVAMGIWGGMFAFATAAGPVVAGLVVGRLGWRWVFFMNLIVCAVAFAIGFHAMSGRRAPAGPRTLDLPGVVALAGMLGGLAGGIMWVPTTGWGHPSVLLAFAGSAACLVLFVLRESRASEPLLPARLFRSVPLSAGTVIVLLTGLATFGVAFYLALYLQQVRGLRPLEAGLTLMPLTVLFIVSAPTGGLLNRRFGPRVPLIVGSLLIAVSMLGLSRVGAESSMHAVWPFLLPLGLGAGFVMPTATEVILSNAPPALAGVAGGLQHTAGMVGTILGVSVLGTLISLRVDLSLGDRLARVGVPQATAEQVTGQLGQVAQGVVPVPPGTPSAVADAITDAGHAAFAEGLRGAALAGFVIASASALLALSVGRDSTHGSENDD